MKTKYFFFPILLFLLLPSCSDVGGDSPVTPGGEEPVEDIVVNLQDNGQAITNPGMGWNLMYYTFDDVMVPNGSDVTDVLDWLPCDIVSFRLSWAKIEPQEGQYNWNVIDDVANRWTAAGKRLAFKFYTNFLWDYANRQATPLWVRDAGAQGRYLDHDGNAANDPWMANYGDPVLLEKLGNFYRAVAEHYKNSTIEFIELGSIGRVGEGNSYQIGVEPTEDELKAHIDLLKNCFPNTQLIINDDYGAVACAYAKSVGYGVDDHSIGVGFSTNPPGRAYNATILDKFKDATTVIGLENDTWLKPDEWYLTQMIAACANYCRIHVSPSRLLLDEVKPVVESMNLKMGYHIQFPMIELPGQVTKGKEFTIAYSIKNVGVGCCTVDGYPRFVFRDTNAREVYGITDTDFKATQLKYGKDSLVINRQLKASIPSAVDASALTLYVCMVDKDNKPVIKLPYSETSASEDRQYKVTQVDVK